MIEYELWDLNDDEILNSAAVGSFLRGLEEEDRNSPQIWEAETEYDFVLKLRPNVNQTWKGWMMKTKRLRRPSPTVTRIGAAEPSKAVR